MNGYIYVGYQNKRTKNGTFKIGETSKTPTIRERQIKRNECYKMVDYVTIHNADKATLLLIEAVVRFELNKFPEFTLTGNDHFRYDITDRVNDIERIRKMAMEIAVRACEQYGVEYEYGKEVG